MLAVALAAALQQPATKISFIDSRGYFKPAFERVLSSAMPGAQVHYFGPVDKRAYNTPADVIVFFPGAIRHSSEVKELWAMRDNSVPQMKEIIREWKKIPGNPRILMCTPVKPSSPYSKEAFDLMEFGALPLMKQAARESGTDILDLYHLLPSGDVSEGLVADMIAEQVAPKLRRAKWKLLSATSEEKDEGPAAMAIDGDPRTYWHSRYSPQPDKNPHEVTFDLGEELQFYGVSYLPRQDGGTNGMAKEYEIYVSDDPNSFGDPVAKGTLKGGTDLKIIPFASRVRARFVRFVIVSEQSGGPYASAAEINVIRYPVSK